MTKLQSENYVRTQEQICTLLLITFNNSQHWFDYIKPNNEKSIIDYQCVDRKGRKCHVELKQRNANIDTFPTILLDATKMYEWAKLSKTGSTLNEQRLYFNFMNDGVIIFDINNQSELMFYPNHKQWNPAEGKYEYRDKFGLPIKNAIVYKRNDDGTLTRVENERYKKTYKTFLS